MQDVLYFNFVGKQIVLVKYKHMLQRSDESAKNLSKLYLSFKKRFKHQLSKRSKSTYPDYIVYNTRIVGKKVFFKD